MSGTQVFRIRDSGPVLFNHSPSVQYCIDQQLTFIMPYLVTYELRIKLLHHTCNPVRKIIK